MAEEYREQVVKTIPAGFARHINWGRLITEFIGIWDKIEIIRGKDGTITIRAFGRVG
jgi:hypothetical protein